MSKATQLLGISNAIVDILAHVDHALIEKMGIAPGSMNLIDEASLISLLRRKSLD